MSSQWKLVPVEPTETMVINGFESVPNECFTDDEVWEQYQEMSGCQQAAFRAKLCWAAMIAAAPNPAPEEVKSGGEPKPYPDRLCHIDYTAHPHRCGCLSGDDEAQRRFDEYQRDTKLAKAEGDVARVTAERDALQLRLTETDQRNDEMAELMQGLIDNPFRLSNNYLDRMAAALKPKAAPEASTLSFTERHIEAEPGQSTERLKGMIEARGGKFAIMIDEANAHYGWTFRKDANGMWVSGRKATDAEMHAARTHAHITNQQ